MSLTIIKTGDSIPGLTARRGDFEDWILAGMENGASLSYTIINVRAGEKLPDFGSLAGVVITGSHSMVTDHEGWSEKTAAWLAEAAKKEIPILGICYGHQLLAYALGGKVGPTPAGPEFGTVKAMLSENASGDPIFGSLPDAIEVQTSHYQSVLELPANSVLLAKTQKDQHSAFRCGKCAWGVQFHPEYDADIANAYINVYIGELDKSGAEKPALECKESIYGGAILRKFAACVFNK